MSKINQLHRIIPVLAVVSLLFSSCTQQICPAYQSFYIHDDLHRQETFSLFNADGLPKTDLNDVKKNKFGIIGRQPYILKERSLHTVAMVDVYPGFVEVDSVVLYAELSVTEDSVPELSIDRFGKIPRPEVGYNTEQEFYSYEFGNVFENKDNYMDQSDSKQADSVQNNIFNWWPFGKNKKAKEPKEKKSELVEPVNTERE